MKFSLRYHTIKIKLPVNISVISLAGDRAHVVTFGMIIAGFLGLKFLESYDTGNVYEIEVIEKQCREYNHKYGFKKGEEKEEYISRLDNLFEEESNLVFLACFLGDSSKSQIVQEKVSNFLKEKGNFQGEISKNIYRKFEDIRKELIKDEELIIDVTEKMNIMIEENKFEEDFRHIVATSFDPSLCEKRQPILNIVYIVNKTIKISSFDRQQKIKISKGTEVVGILNKLKNIFRL